MRGMEIFLLRHLRSTARGHGFLAVCLGLALVGTLTAVYPVTAVVVPAALLLPQRWRQVAVFTALGSALGATALVAAFHHLAWTQVYAHFADFSAGAAWDSAAEWVTRYGAFALFLVAASPLPQTPALLVFSMARHDFLIIFIAMLLGKLLKYGLLAWVAACAPDRLRHKLHGYLRYRNAFRRRAKKP